ncbi:hypothetical protein BH24ACT3_BH24ACT3_02380 [soil metagenome]
MEDHAAAISSWDTGISLGSLLFTLVEPHRGHEVAYNRWYERDHFYAGCLVGPWLFAGRRWVATRELKDLRASTDPALFGEADLGSYLALYWVQKGRHDEHFSWALDQVKWLHANDRMFTERDHIHTLLYKHRWTVGRDDDGVPAELALDHPFEGLVSVIVERAAGVSDDDLAGWFTTEARGLMAGTPAALCIGAEPIPLPPGAPVTQPGLDGVERRSLQLWFLDEPPARTWGTVFAGHDAALEAAGVGRVRWAAPFVPTVPGTDTYTDQLW